MILYPNRKTPTSTSGSGTPYSASVTIVSSGEYRRAAFPIETLSGEGGRVPHRRLDVQL